MKKFYFFLFFLIIIYSCQQKNSDTQKYIDFTFVKDIVLPIEDTAKNIVIDYQYIKQDTLNLLVVYLNNRKLLIYDIEKQKLIQTIQLAQIPIIAFDYINSDSILVYYNPAYNTDYLHDSTLLLINSQGDVIDIYSWKNTPVWSAENPEYAETEVGYASLLFQHLPYKNNKIYMTFNIYYRDYFCDTTYLHNEKIPLLGYFDIQTNSFSSLPVYKYPQLYDTLKFPNAFARTFVSFTADDKPILTFAYTPELLIFDEPKNKIYHQKISSVIFDTICPISLSQGDINRYTYLIYDSVYQNYYRFIKLAQNKYGKNQNYVIVADKNFCRVAEGLYPSNVSPRFQMIDSNILAFNYSKTFKFLGKIVFSIYKPVFRETDTNFITVMKRKLDSVNQCFYNTNDIKANLNIEDFINNFSVNDTNFLLIILPLKSCSTCLNTALNFISLYAEPIFNSNVKLLFSGTNTTQINKILDEYNLNLYKNDIFIDSVEKYYIYNKFDIINPRIVIIKDKEIFFDTVYIPDSMKDFKLKLKYYVENQQ